MTDIRTGPLRRRLAAFGRFLCRWPLRVVLVLALVSALFLSAIPRQANAQGAPCGLYCVAILFVIHAPTQGFISITHAATRKAITAMMEEHKQSFMVEIFFYKWILSGMQAIANQITAAAMGQMFMIGSFLDAQEQMSRQTMFEEMAARAHKAYHPSTQMCSIGSATQGLASAARNAELVAHTLSQRSLDRQLHSRNTAGASGGGADINNRIEQFKSRYCDPDDNNREPAEPGTGLTLLCGAAGPGGEWANLDVTAGRLFGATPVRARYGNGGNNDADDPDLLALAANLYGSNLIRPVPEKLLEPKPNMRETSNQGILLDIRSIAAKRSVAEDSFNQIAGMQSMGNDAGGASAPFMAALMRAMGYSAADAATVIHSYPSYNARMELLGKKIYMDPEFYTNLYDTPDNVARMGAAMRAVGMIQDMDTYKSRLRAEMSLSVLLELMIDDEQAIVNGRLAKARPVEE